MTKDILLVVCVLIAVASAAVAVNSFEKKDKLYKTLQEERYSRMVAEESLQKNAAKVATLENQLKTSDERMAKIKEILNQEKALNGDLKRQYEKLMRTKADLEGKLKLSLQEQAASPQTFSEVAPAAASMAPAGAR